MDRDSSGTIDKVEFEKAMSVLKIDLRKEDIHKLFLRFDRDRQGLDYREFLELLDFRESNSKDEKDNSPPGGRYKGSGR
jgi:Ca2+-binding EF-hand superfamily protein